MNCCDPEVIDEKIQDDKTICEGKLIGNKYICVNCLYQLRIALGIENIECEMYDEDLLEGGELKKDRWELW
ncbi:MAG: hypothetical protein ACLFMM_07125 [Methanohalobium sp.]